MSTVTLKDGSTATVTQSNYRALALKQIELNRAADPTYNVAQQSAVLSAFKQLAGLGSATFNNAPAERVAKNPLVRGSDAIMSALPDGLRTVATDSSNTTVSVLVKAKTAATSAAATVTAAAKEVNRTALVGAVGLVLLGGGYLVWSFKK